MTLPLVLTVTVPVRHRTLGDCAVTLRFALGRPATETAPAEEPELDHLVSVRPEGRLASVDPLDYDGLEAAIGEDEVEAFLVTSLRVADAAVREAVRDAGGPVRGPRYIPTPGATPDLRTVLAASAAAGDVRRAARDTWGPPGRMERAERLLLAGVLTAIATGRAAEPGPLAGVALDLLREPL